MRTAEAARTTRGGRASRWAPATEQGRRAAAVGRSQKVPPLTAIMTGSTGVHVRDDIDGSEGAEPVRFSYLGVDYEINLTTENRAAMERKLQPFIHAARKTPATPERFQWK